MFITIQSTAFLEILVKFLFYSPIVSFKGVTMGMSGLGKRNHKALN